MSERNTMVTNVDLVEAFYRAFDSNQPQLLAEVLATDWQALPAVPGNPGGLVGQQGTVAYLHSVFGGLTYKPLEIIDGGPDTTVARAQLCGVHIGEFLGVPATGRQVTLNTIEVHKISNGRIQATHHIEDFFGALQQLTRPSIPSA